MLIHNTLVSWLSFTALAVSGAHVRRSDAIDPNDNLQNLVSKLRNLIPGSLGILTPVAGISKEYDYVVVGAGTGGTTLAVRLAQSGASVALVEAGEFHLHTSQGSSSNMF